MSHLMYPQVTAYTHKDDNNKWLVKKANSKAPPPGQSQFHVLIHSYAHVPIPLFQVVTRPLKRWSLYGTETKLCWNISRVYIMHWTWTFFDFSGFFIARLYEALSELTLKCTACYGQHYAYTFG